MLDQLSIHSGISMHILAKGDLKIDDHHTIEDIGIVLGEALSKTLNHKNGLSRYGFVLPMDESQSKCIIDLSNRPYLSFNAKFQHKMVGDLNT
jgi:imidazoleglycerol-phosphate dehydratase/histidinol-phosphatase